MSSLSNLAVRDIETVVHPYTQLAALRETGPLVLEHAKGVFVYDTEGKAYIEGMAAVVHRARLRQRRAGRGRIGADAQASVCPPLYRQEP